MSHVRMCPTDDTPHWASGIAVALVAACIVGACSTSAHAADTSLLLFGASKHLNVQGDRKFNERNPGIGLEVREGGWHAGALTYKDSFNDRAWAAYAGYRYSYEVTQDLKLQAGLRVGYLHGSGFHQVVPLPTVGVQYGKVALEAFFAPARRKGAADVVGAFIRIDF
ncbi:antimicrobial peptide resistance and lipid A acylation protein PagP [Ralstonia phage phiAp1]|uniref:Putative PagP-like protein n=1 Tax=Ralstonia phage phiAp1 TaxID=2783867 RepID=A0A1L7DS28_9CAUD|nr:antimicrobial peptide resistance and lipid A acylation protein PagP [Ralstonia phage phiAp1]APU03152.1 putative PagP-like protein [Ralstonia phage phiAp1]